MSGMTNEQFDKVLSMIIEILKSSKDLDEAIAKVQSIRDKK